MRDGALHAEDVRQQSQPALRAKSGLGSVEELAGPHLVTDGVRRHAEGAQRVGVHDGLDLDRGEALDDDRAAQDRLGNGEGRDVPWVVASRRQALGDGGHAGPRLGAGVGPPAAQSRAEQQVQRQVGLPGLRRAFRRRAQRQDAAGIAGYPVVEDLAQPRHPCVVQLGQGRPLGCGDEPVDEVRPAEPEADLRGEQQPSSAARRVGRQVRRALEGGDRGSHPAAPQAFRGRVLQLVGYLVVGSGDGQGSVPGPAVGLVGEHDAPSAPCASCRRAARSLWRTPERTSG